MPGTRGGAEIYTGAILSTSINVSAAVGARYCYLCKLLFVVQTSRAFNCTGRLFRQAQRLPLQTLVVISF